MITKIKDYVQEVVKEMKKVSWPTKQQLKESTIVVIGATLVITLLVWLIDQAMGQIIGLFL